MRMQRAHLFISIRLLRVQRIDTTFQCPIQPISVQTQIASALCLRSCSGEHSVLMTILTVVFPLRCAQETSTTLSTFVIILMAYGCLADNSCTRPHYPLISSTRLHACSAWTSLALPSATQGFPRIIYSACLKCAFHEDVWSISGTVAVTVAACTFAEHVALTVTAGLTLGAPASCVILIPQCD